MDNPGRLRRRTDDEMDWLRFDDDLQAYEADLIATAGTLLLGRITLNDFAGHWPQRRRRLRRSPARPRLRPAFDALDKVVVSTSGQLADWTRTSHWLANRSRTQRHPDQRTRSRNT